MKRTVLVFLLFGSILIFGFKGTQNSSQPPQGYSGSNGFTCNSCHGGSLGVNGNVQLIGMPTTFAENVEYPIMVRITTTNGGIRRWGFQLEVRNTADEPMGTFSTTNANVAVQATNEVSHNSAPFTTPISTAGVQVTYTFNNITWKAPVTAGTNDNTAKFTVAGMASNGNGNNGGDFVYTASNTLTLPVTFGTIQATYNGTNAVRIQWSTTQESNSKHFIIERSTNGITYSPIATIAAAGNSSTTKQYSYNDQVITLLATKVYYRIIQVDLNLQQKKSGIYPVTLTSTVANQIIPYPNPIVGNTIDLNINSTSDTKGTIKVTNSLGVLVAIQQVQLSKGHNFVTIANSKGLHYTGVYTVQLILPNAVLSTQVLAL